MEQKLLTLLSRRTAWILLAVCAAFWLVLATGFLEAPLGTPPTLMFLWMYCSLMLALGSVPVAAAAVAALVLHRSVDRAGAANGAGPAVPEDADRSRRLYLLLHRELKKQ
ncbi:MULTISPECIES: hypothetical protein [unclassified Arthrobacter]|uniref:hypothetical protein n=1 Tax=unclassified Arthrobacter TaxID=235627 RepID=UPI00210638FC|nr:MULTISPECIES: hypothetical protein [unclassified Arthrobacter]MCQ1946224.1 hypothetical protein [Arthrobacter sp. zg-Y1116]MCQ1986165.1 hypothetical protein [Arthrobacter sp. zg-Y844]MCQ1994095.1 hypothetical protein [Arthrobacter sp. zg-Y1171]UWX81800.1 hypothetical protein N2L00_15675 [Arthrobacter sp. zg-Y1171]